MHGYVGLVLHNYVSVQILYLGCTWFHLGVLFCTLCENWQIVSIVILAYLDFIVENSINCYFGRLRFHCKGFILVDLDFIVKDLFWEIDYEKL
jgi:hypothetical protein